MKAVASICGYFRSHQERDTEVTPRIISNGHTAWDEEITDNDTIVVDR